jgi:Fe-S-cluster containining protein
VAATLDCQACGACCCNSDENRAEGYPWYVPVDDPRSPLLRKPELVRRYVVADPEGDPHLRLDPSGRCAALLGRLGDEVSCAVYAHRPRACRRVMPGDAACRKARQERGIDG